MSSGENSSLLFDLIFVVLGILINAVMFYHMVWKNYTKERLMGPTGAQGPRGDKGPKGNKGPRGNAASRGAKGPRGDAGERGDSAKCWTNVNANKCTSDWSSMGLTRMEDLEKGCLFGYKSTIDSNGQEWCRSDISPSCSYKRESGITINVPGTRNGWGDLDSPNAEISFGKWRKSLANFGCSGVPKNLSSKWWAIRNS